MGALVRVWPALIFLGCGSLLLRGEAGPFPAVPLLEDVSPAERTGSADGGLLSRLNSADQALQLGMAFVAESLYREILEREDLSEEMRQRVTLSLVSALLEADNGTEARRFLEAYHGPHDSAYFLRSSLALLHLRRLDDARQALERVVTDELPNAERGWPGYVRGLLADAAGDFSAAQRHYDEALERAVSDLQRSRFLLGRERSKLLFGQASEAQAAELRRRTQEYQGKKTGFQFAQRYAIVLDLLDRKQEAERFLQRQIELLPPEEKEANDQFRLLLGMIAGPSSSAGRAALRQLWQHGNDRELQRYALHMLAGSAIGAHRDEFKRDLNQLIGAASPHPLQQDLLVFRAQLALADRAYTQVEADAKLFLERFPGSHLRVNVLSLLTSMNWELKRYRTVANHIRQLRAAMPEGPDRAELAVLLAEAHFRAADYQNAADLYGAALREAPSGIAPGVLMFQRVLCLVRADRLDAALRLLDELAGDRRFDAVHRWQAEWNLIKALQVRGRISEAYERIERLATAQPEEDAQAVSAELRLRVAWLRARLAYDSDRPALAVRLVDELLATGLGAGSVPDPALRTAVASTSLLLKAQAHLHPTLNEPEAGLALLDTLRAEHPGSNAAVYSYIVQANYLALNNQTVEAQQLLIKLVDEHPKNRYAPVALYEASLNAERRGLEEHMRQAYTLLERLVSSFPQHELYFYARLKQGDLLRKIDEFPAAQQIYTSLLNEHPQHPDIVLAEIALADCLFAQGSRDQSRFERAIARMEKLMDLPNAPVDLRVEAGFKYGHALARKGNATEAIKIYWLVAAEFLLKEQHAVNLGSTGRYWMSRALLEMGQLAEDGARLDEGRRAYTLILEYNLPGQLTARDRLARFNLAALTTGG